MGYRVGSVRYCRPDGVVHRTAPLASCSAFHLGSCLSRWSKRHFGFPLHRQVRPPASYGIRVRVVVQVAGILILGPGRQAGGIIQPLRPGVSAPPGFLGNRCFAHEPRSVLMNDFLSNMVSKKLFYVSRHAGMGGNFVAHRTSIRSLQPLRRLIADSHGYESSAGGHCGSCAQ